MRELEILRIMAIHAQQEASRWHRAVNHVLPNARCNAQRFAGESWERANALNTAYHALLKAASDDPFEKWPDTGVVCPRCGHKTMPRDDPRPPEEPFHWHEFDCVCGETIEVRVHFAEHWWLPGPGESYYSGGF